MVRSEREARAAQDGLPHTRGDGPKRLVIDGLLVTSSPHAWGWSARELDAADGAQVFPTRVGMVRLTRGWRRWWSSLPHTRGDGPATMDSVLKNGTSSPHAWGWSDIRRTRRPGRGVFPTRVGMVRRRRRRSGGMRCLPHTRGDGPALSLPVNHTGVSSPHAWGWSGSQITSGAFSGVFPTRVGMVRIRCRSSRSWRCLPHTRGDGPRYPSQILDYGWSSPHAWGWSVMTEPWLTLTSVFPTRVGMVRLLSPHNRRPQSLPHTRGDGPPVADQPSGHPQSSPHAWGWSVFAARRGFPPVVFPTRVGMVR